MFTKQPPGRRPSFAAFHVERLEDRKLCAADSAPTTGHMRVGMNLENITDWSPAWTFTDVFQSSRPWISQAVNLSTGSMAWDVGDTHPLQVDANGVPVSLESWTQNGQPMRQMAGTLMFRELGGAYPGGIYRAEWQGTGRVSFGFDARAVTTGTLPDGRSFADLQVTPGDGGIYLRIEATSPADPIRDIHVWMPDYAGEKFAGQRWQPGAAFSPFHPLFRERLAPFGVIRFMGMQETNASDIRAWADRRDAADIRQASGPGPSANSPIVNGVSVEYMVQLANDLHADPWFNMPHMADDTFVRNFATYVRDHLEAGRKAYVEWSNEVWNFAWGFEASQWVSQQAAREGLSQWQVAGHEAKRDLDIWSSVFAGQTDRLVRVAAGWAANDWVTGQVLQNMGGSFDAIAIAPYFSPDDAQRASYTAATTVDRVLADSRTGMTQAITWTSNHRQLADQWSAALHRPIQLLAYEGGQHLDGRGAPYQNAFHAAANDPRMGDLYRDYLRGLDTAGMNLYVDFQFTGAAGAAPWGDFAKLHRMDEPLDTAYRYRAVVDAAKGGLWGETYPPPVPPVPPAPPLPTIGIDSATVAERNTGVGRIFFTITLSATAARNVTVRWATENGTATAGSDYSAASGSVTFRPGQTSRSIRVLVNGDRITEANETFFVTLSLATNATVSNSAGRGTGTILDDDTPRRSLAMAAAMVEDSSKPWRPRG